MTYLRYLCLFAHSGVQRILCCLCVSCVPYVASFSGFSICHCLLLMAVHCASATTCSLAVSMIPLYVV
jgi:hypothetical protein